MSWLRSSPLRQSLTRNGGTNNSSNGGSSNSSTSFFSTNNNNNSMSLLRQRPIDSATDCDPRACYDSFCKHWQQAYDIIQRSELPHKPPTHDDVLAVVSHLDFMVTLLLVELHHCNKIQLPTSEGSAAAPPPAPCLEYMLSENLLDKLYEWGCTTGRYSNAVRLEQLKLYELLVSHSRHQLLCHEPFLRPLLKILGSSQGEIFPPDLEKRLVILLNQLCVVLMQNVHLLDLFFFTAQTQEQQQQQASDYQRHNGTMSNFIIFSLLIPYVHREGSLGHQARDALLLCMALSQKNSNVGTYIAQYSSMCPLLVTGLGGLYSRLPNSIEITSIDWHRITPDDVTEIPELTLFMNALEFCNAVVQVAHEMIKQQLLDFLYQGFLVPVLGPAILQTNIDSQISTMSYLDLMLRSVTEPSLLRLFIKFLLDTEKFDGERILDSLIERLSSSDANLCMVTMALFETLLGLHCEDLMLELLLKFLLPGKHVPISYRHKINKVDPYTNTAEYLLNLTPDVMKRARELTKHKNLGETVAQKQPPQPHPSPTSTMSKTIGANWNYYGMYTGDSLYANFHAYLFESHWRIAQCQSACSKWANCYRYQKWLTKGMRSHNAQALEMAKQFFNEFSLSPLASTATMTNMSTISGCVMEQDLGDKKQLDSLQSLGESSGYESFKWRPADDDSSEQTNAVNSPEQAPNTTILSMESGAELLDISVASSSKVSRKETSLTSSVPWRVSSQRNDSLFNELDFSEDIFAQGTATMGPFINAIWGKLQTFTSNTLYVNLHLTGLITRLAWYPLPLIQSILLRPDIVITADTPSFLQVLRILKQQIDAELPVVEDSLEIIDIARSHLIDREFRLMNARKATDQNSPMHMANTKSAVSSAQGNVQLRNNQVQVTPSSSYDPFRRNEVERKSIRKSISNMFRSSSSSSSNNRTNASSGLSQLKAFFTGAATTLSNTINNQAAAGATHQMPGSSSTIHETRETSLSTMPVATTTHAKTTNDTQNAANSLSGGASTVSATTKTPLSGSTTTLTSHQSNASITTLMPTTQTTTTSIASAATGIGSLSSEPVSLESLSSMGALVHTSGTERTRDLALCAVLLDEWLKELAAIAQEQSVVLLSSGDSNALIKG